MVVPVDLDGLERTLAPLAHGDEARTVLREALKDLKTGARLDLLNRSLLRAPIFHDDVKDSLDPAPELFHVLQGDVIRTDAAYVLGRRRYDNPTYIIATSTCDLVPKRRKTVTLLEVEPKRAGYAPDNEIKTHLAQLTKFQHSEYFYLPRIPGDEADVLYNVVHIDATAQCDNDILPLVERRASMTLIGWRVFGALLRGMSIREAREERDIRTCTILTSDDDGAVMRDNSGDGDGVTS